MHDPPTTSRLSFPDSRRTYLLFSAGFKFFQGIHGAVGVTKMWLDCNIAEQEVATIIVCRPILASESRKFDSARGDCRPLLVRTYLEELEVSESREKMKIGAATLWELLR